ncbi:uncharacterized protein F4822DRAFT_16706 [Hypoxylon trugodes]|uniref:uncharacterized protein n=1 Tax=Hypoxylon trugodes TaxID=326681 RepID=UPI0021961463|nr:uncharacterized protein F4822DRAFT_16706 [Hypoxylon trugodes]KAI1393557.1 hypothetical protein F4822DRAFT_16706 [Hypoxylon trugodes]
MAPVPFQHPVRYIPLAAVGTHLISVVYLTYAIIASLYTSYKSLGPAQDTRSRLAQRKRLVPVFVGLAVAAFSVAAYTSVASAILSYKTWAYEHGVDRPEQYEQFTTKDELFPPPENTRRLDLSFIAHWLSDTPVYFDALEIVAEKARRFWWSQQIDVATAAFSILLSIEGRRRKIPLNAAFLILAHLVNLSFAQNLFYIALLLTPTPLSSSNDGLDLPVAPRRLSVFTWIRNNLVTPKPRNWYPHPSLLVTALAFSYSSILLLPYAAETPSFRTIAFLGRASTFLPVILPEVVPVNWGKVHSHPHGAYRSLIIIFRTVAAASFAIHVKSSIAGLAYNVPNSSHHRHSVFLPWDVEERTTWERSTTALVKVLGSINDHPAVTAVGWDVLLCTLSLGLWVATRATNAQDVIQSIFPIPNLRRKVEHSIEGGIPSTPVKADPEPVEDITPEHHMVLRRRGRSARRVGSVASSSGPSEDGFRTPAKRRGRPKKSKQPEEEKSYTPSSSEARDLVEGDVLPAKELDWEDTALTWGLAALLGLGSASSSVFGGECISR